MITNDLLILGTAMSIFASVTGFLAYVPLVYKARRPVKVSANYIIITMNVIIGICMVFVGSSMFTALINHTNIVDISHLNSSTFSLAVVLVSFFVVSQVAYLLLSNSRLEKESRTIQAEKANLSETWFTNDKPIDENDLRQKIRFDINNVYLRILDMSYPLSTTKLYIPARVQVQEPGLDATFEPEFFMWHRQKNTETRVRIALEPEQALLRWKRCLILGDPGTGKTTLLKYLTMRYAAEEFADLPNLPIYIGLHDFATSIMGEKTTLKDFVVKEWSRRYGISEHQLRTYLTGKLERGEAVLLLDALDETFIGSTFKQARQNYEWVVDKIEQFTEECSRTPVVVTVRKSFYHSDLLSQNPLHQNFEKLYIVGAFSLKEMHQFIDNWFASKPDQPTPGYAADLKTRLEQNIQLQTLAANPLILSLIVSTYAEMPELPAHRAIIYQQSVTTLLSKWDATRDIHRFSRVTLEQREELYQDVAWYLQEKKTYYIPEQDLRKRFIKVTGRPPSGKEAFYEFDSQSTLLVRQGSDFSFLHPTFQQYFAAQSCLKQENIHDLLKHRFDPWWEEVILLYAAYADASPLVEQLLASENHAQEEELFHTSLVLAGRCLATAPIPWSNDLTYKVIDPLFSLLLDTPYQLTREQAAMTLVEIGGYEVNRRLLDLLAQGEYRIEVQTSIIKAFGEVGEHSVASELLNLLMIRTNNIILRKHIADALGLLGARSIADELVKLLADQSIDQALRWHIAIALVRLGEYRGEVTETLLQILKASSKSPIEAREIEAREIAEDLKVLIANRQLDKEVRERIIRALSQIGDTSNTRNTTERILGQLNNSSLEVSIRSCIAISLGTLEVSMLLRSSRKTFSVEGISPTDTDTIEDITDEQDLQGHARDLVPLLSRPQISLEVRISVAEAIGELGDREVVLDLCELLKQKDIAFEVRSAIATTLGTLGDVSINQKLLLLLRDENIEVSVRCSIAIALGELSYYDDKSVVPSLRKMHDSESLDNALHRSITITLGRLGDKNVLDQLLRWLVDPQIEQDEREDIIYALYMQDRSQVVSKLLPELRDTQSPPEKIRARIVDIIGYLADNEETVKVLVKLMNTLTPADAGEDEAKNQHEEMINRLHQALWHVSRRVDDVSIRRYIQTGELKVAPLVIS